MARSQATEARPHCYQHSSPMPQHARTTPTRLGDSASLQQFVAHFSSLQLPKDTAISFVWPLPAPGHEATLSAVITPPGQTKDLVSVTPEVCGCVLSSVCGGRLWAAAVQSDAVLACSHATLASAATVRR